MIPSKKGHLNAFQYVHIPSVRHLFDRVGRVVPPPTVVDPEVSVLDPRKNDLINDVMELADRVPAPDKPEDDQ